MGSLQQLLALSNIISHGYHPLISCVRKFFCSVIVNMTHSQERYELHMTLQFVLHRRYRKSCEMTQQVLNVQFSI